MKSLKKLKPIHHDEVIGLLQKSALPWDDIDLTAQDFIGHFMHNKLVAIGALEWHLPYALLRSVAVHPDHQNKQLGKQLTLHLIAVAKAGRANNLFLLTTTADGYFKKLGFKKIIRTEIPKSIQSSAQFALLCPETAISMYLQP